MEDSAAAHGRKALGVSRMSAYTLLSFLETDLNSRDVDGGYAYQFWKNYKDGLKDYLWHLEKEWKTRGYKSNKSDLSPPTGAILPPWMFHYPLIYSFQITHHKRYPNAEKEGTFDILMDEKMRPIYYPLGLYEFKYYNQSAEKEEEGEVDPKHFLFLPRDLIKPRYCEATLRSQLICGALVTHGRDFCSIHVEKRIPRCLHMTRSGIMCRKSKMEDADGCKDHKGYLSCPLHTDEKLSRCCFYNADGYQCPRHVYCGNGDKCIFHLEKIKCRGNKCKYNVSKNGDACKRHKRVGDRMKEKYHVEGHEVVSVKYTRGGVTVVYTHNIIDDKKEPAMQDAIL